MATAAISQALNDRGSLRPETRERIKAIAAELGYTPNKHAAALRSGAQAPQADPTIAVSAMAHVTRHVGFGITANLTYEHPFQFARRFSTLDHLTGGRIAWNIVTNGLANGTAM